MKRKRIAAFGIICLFLIGLVLHSFNREKMPRIDVPGPKGASELRKDKKGPQGSRQSFVREREKLHTLREKYEIVEQELKSEIEQLRALTQTMEGRASWIEEHRKTRQKITFLQKKAFDLIEERLENIQASR